MSGCPAGKIENSVDGRLKLVQDRFMVRNIYLVLTLAFLAVLIAYGKDACATEPYISGMVGVFNSGKSSLAETKFINLGLRAPLGFGLTQQGEFGGWVDIAGNGRKSSQYAAYQVGIEASQVVTVRVMTGLAAITTPDTYLGGVIPEFTEDFFLGLRGTNGNTVGVKYKHISNAGIFKQNMGRDFAGVEASVSF